MKPSFPIIGALVLVLALGDVSAEAKPGDKDKQPKKEKPAQPKVKSEAKDKKGEPWVDVKVSLPEREIIEEYVTVNPGVFQSPSQGGKKIKNKGNKKPKNLPPGLRKKLERGGTLPPGWQKKLAAGEVISQPVYEQEVRPLPPEVVIKLPPQPEGTILVTIDGKVARILKATREILDVFEVGKRHDK